MFYDNFPVGTRMTVIDSDDDTPYSGIVVADSTGSHLLAVDDGIATVYSSPAEVVYCSIEHVTANIYLKELREKEKDGKKMSKKVLGKEKVDYVSKKTNNPVTGITLHCCSNVVSDRCEGQQVETIFVSSKSPMYDQVVAFPIGSDIDVMYNRWGSVESVTLSKKG